MTPDCQVLRVECRMFTKNCQSIKIQLMQSMPSGSCWFEVPDTCWGNKFPRVHVMFMIYVGRKSRFGNHIEFQHAQRSCDIWCRGLTLPQKQSKNKIYIKFFMVFLCFSCFLAFWNKMSKRMGSKCGQVCAACPRVSGSCCSALACRRLHV